jgi:hypothetical protein
MKVVNLRHETADVYCGRPSSYRAEYGSDCSIFGNPFPIEPGVTRKEAVQAYAQLLDENQEFYAEKLRILLEYEKQLGRELKLGCFCAPKRCHCDELVKFAKTKLRYVPRPKVRKSARSGKQYDEELYDSLLEALSHQKDERGETQHYGDKSLAVDKVLQDMLQAHPESYPDDDAIKALSILLWETVAEITTEEYR